MSLRQAVLEAVLRLCECSCRQVVAEVSHAIPAAQAATAGRSRYRHDTRRGKKRRPSDVAALVVAGRSQAVREALKKLASRRKIRRVRRGVYAPPAPKLYLTG